MRTLFYWLYKEARMSKSAEKIKLTLSLTKTAGWYARAIRVKKGEKPFI